MNWPEELPDGWCERVIANVAPFQRGFDLPARSIRPGPYPIIYSNGVGGTHAAFMAKGPGVVTGRSGTLGKVFYTEQDFWPHNTSLWVTDFKGNDPKFIAYLYEFIDLGRFASGSGVPTFNRNDAHSFIVRVPCARSEQKRIAQALGDIDELIASLDALIAKKRDIKQGAMQQLLSGRRRLPGFSEHWVNVALAEVATFSKGYGLSKAAISESGRHKCVHYGELFTSYPAVIKAVRGRTSASDLRRISRQNDVLMPTSDVTPNGLATASCVLEPGVVIGADVLVISGSPDRLWGPFLSYAIRWDRAQIMSLVSGTTVFHIYPTDMRRFQCALPSLAEQKAIAGLLEELDDEITQLDQKLLKSEMLRQGMIQQLLTGRIRLI